MTGAIIETDLNRRLLSWCQLTTNKIVGLATLWKSAVSIQGVELGLPLNLSLHMKGVLVRGKYEQNELSILRTTLEKDDVVLEFGTGLGLLAIHSAKIVGSDNVTTYEANPELEEAIRDNFRRNRVSPTLHIAAVGKESGKINFSISPDFWASSLIRPDNWKITPRHMRNRTHDITVAVESVRECISSVSPSFLICDLEGGEYEISKVWDLSTVSKLLIELHPGVIGEDKARKVVRRIEDSNMKLDHGRSHRAEKFFVRER